MPRAIATTTRITRAATRQAVRSRASRTTRQRWGAGATRSSGWTRIGTADSWSRPTSCARCSTSTARHERSPWPCGCSLRTRAARLRRREMLTNGASVIGQMLKVLIEPARRATDLDEHGDGRSDRRGRSRRRRASLHETAPRSTSRRARASCSRRAASVATRTCVAGTAATSPTRRSGRSRTRATPVKCCRRRCGWARRPTYWMRPGGSHRFSSPTPAPVPSARGGSDRGPSTSTGPASGSATSRTPMSRSARRCTPTRRCRAGRSSTRAMSAGTCRARTRSRSAPSPRR